MSCLAGQPHDMNQPSTYNRGSTHLITVAQTSPFETTKKDRHLKDNGKERKQNLSARMTRGSNHDGSFLVGKCRITW